MIAPGTELGRWSLGLLAAFAAGLSLFGLAVAAGQRGGDGFFDNMWLTGRCCSPSLPLSARLSPEWWP